MSRERLLNGFYNVDEVTFNVAGNMTSRQVAMTKDAACVLLFNPDSKAFILVSQVRSAVIEREDPYVVEVPAGMLEEDEDPEACIRREALEETGYALDDVRFLFSCFSAPGLMTEKMHYFYAEVKEENRLQKGGGLSHEDEVIEVVELPLDKAKAMMRRNEIEDAKTLMSILWFINNSPRQIKKS